MIHRLALFLFFPIALAASPSDGLPDFSGKPDERFHQVEKTPLGNIVDVSVSSSTGGNWLVIDTVVITTIKTERMVLSVRRMARQPIPLQTEAWLLKASLPDDSEWALGHRKRWYYYLMWGDGLGLYLYPGELLPQEKRNTNRQRGRGTAR